jgi:hypothetical protein
VTKLKRKYSQKTLKVLFALSGNQCAHPECENPIIEPATEQSDDHVSAQISHIYALNENGPRGRVGLTEKELNAPANLILLCPTHHGIADGQYESYPAEKLTDWKKTHESKMKQRLSTNLESVQPDVFAHPYFPKELVDQKIENEIDILRKSRFFVEFESVHFSLALGRRLIEKELSGGSDAVRSRALAWCSRILSPDEEQVKAEEYLKLAKSLGTCPEIDIANAFISSYKGEKGTALNTLAGIDSPISRSAAFLIIVHHEGAEVAIDWLKTAGIVATDLDPEGKYFLLARHFELAHWDDTNETLDAISDQDLETAPVLNHMIAMAHLLSAVPNDSRSAVLEQIPLDTAKFPLASDTAAINACRTAHRYFTAAAEAGLRLDCPRAAAIDEEYALWLELKDPDTSKKGRQRLEDKLREPKSSLRLVSLAVQFKIKLNLLVVKQEIERQIALHGGITLDTALARFALAFTKKTPKDVASYIGRHYDELSKHINKKAMRGIQIEMFSRAGLLESAKECLGFLQEEGLSEAEERRLRRAISEVEGTDPIKARKEQYRQTKSLSDLALLVDGLESKGDWDNLCKYGEILFKETRSVNHLECLANALYKTHKAERLIELLREDPNLLARAKNLQMLFCWSLFNQGELLNARSELEKLNDDLDNPNYRFLKVQLGIALGEWISLLAFVENEYLKRDNRTSQDLIGTAQLAFQLNSPYAKNLVLEATVKGKDDAGILATAYFLASNFGWERDEDTLRWLHKSAALSGNNGPIQQMTLKDVLNRMPEWNRQESDIWQRLNCGKIPMYLAAQHLNKSLIELMLFPALINQSERDPRRRIPVFAFSGQRQIRPFENIKSVGIDATTLLTLSFRNLLNITFEIFDVIHIPHSTLRWLFNEKQKAVFHQPSRIKDAHQVLLHLATNVLEKFVLSAEVDSDLSAQIGDELAMLIAEAEKVREDDNTQRIVVRSPPVHRIASLMAEEADMTGHATVMTSCISIVEKLKQKGQITAEQEKRARAFLQLRERPWPQEPEISDGAVLYLDELSISSFIHLGILEKINAAGLKPIASPRTISEAYNLISYEKFSKEIVEAIERIRFIVSSNIESGKIKVGKQLNVDELDAQLISDHPTVGVTILASDCDAIISDDRFLNQHAYIECGDMKAPIYTSLDLLNVLVSRGLITYDDRSEHMTLLRRAGYSFIPISYDELTAYLAVSEVKKDTIIETAELKAIRENILHVRMNNWLQLPKETTWLDTTLKVFIRVLKSLWKADADISRVMVLSNWIMKQVDFCGWAHSLGIEKGENFLKSGRGAHVMMMFTLPFDTPQSIKNAYWSWLENKVLIPIKEQYPDLYTLIVEWQIKQISEMVDLEMTNESINDE